jgi:hypothetical protein
MLKQVQHNKERGLLRVKRLIRDRIRSLQDDKDGGALVASSPITIPIPFLPAVEMTNNVVDRMQKG